MQQRAPQSTNTAARSDDPAAKHDHGFFGHPLGLANLFGVEIWERFSFYGLQAILVYYLYHKVSEGGLGLDQGASTAVIGAYGGMVYLATIGGSWLADRLFGAERTLFYSAVVIMAGHLSLSAIHNVLGIFIGLSLIALGSGGLKATASSVLGELYSADDTRRDGGFSIFYMGINIGAFIGPLCTAWVQEHHGYHWGFATAAAGMALGLLQYAALRRRTIGHAGHRPDSPVRGTALWIPVAASIAVVGISTAIFATGTIALTKLADFTSVCALIFALIMWTHMYRSNKVTDEERSRLIGFLPMFVATAAFFSIFQQQFTVLAIYTDERLNRNLFGHEIPAGWMQSINPIFIIIFAGIFAATWTKMGTKQPSTPIKYAIALVIVGVAPFCFLPFAGGGANSTPYLVIVGILFLFTLGELLISPIGLSLATKLAPAAFRTQMMSLHMLSLAIGTAMAGSLAGFYDPSDASSERSYFLFLGLSTIALGIVMIFVSRWILKKFQGVR